MTRKIFTLASLAGVLLAALAMSSLTRPAAAIDPTLDAALIAITQATARAAQEQAAQRAAAAAQVAAATRQAQNVMATAAALSAEATRQANNAEATRQAQSAQATQSAIDELHRQRAMTATAQAQSIVETRTAQDATAMAQVMNVQATATSQAMAIAAQATDTARLSATYATRQDRFTWGLLLVEIFFVCGAAWVLWKLTGTLSAWAVKMRPQADPQLAGLIGATATAQPAGSDFGELSRAVVIEQAPGPEPRMPSFVQVVDNPEMEAAISRWAERYDAEHGDVGYSGGDNGDN